MAQVQHSGSQPGGRSSDRSAAQATDQRLNLRAFFRDSAVLTAGSLAAMGMFLLTLIVLVHTLEAAALGLLIVVNAYPVLCHAVINLQSWQGFIRAGSEPLASGDLERLASLIKFFFLFGCGHHRVGGRCGLWAVRAGRRLVKFRFRRPNLPGACGSHAVAQLLKFCAGCFPALQGLSPAGGWHVAHACAADSRRLAVVGAVCSSDSLCVVVAGSSGVWASVAVWFCLVVITYPKAGSLVAGAVAVCCRTAALHVLD